MSFIAIATDVVGNVGNTSSKPVKAGPTFISVTGDDFTGVTTKIQFSVDGITFYDVDGLSVTGAGKHWIVNLPAGHLRANITGGGAGDNIDVRFHQSAFQKVFTSETITRTNN